MQKLFALALFLSAGVANAAGMSAVPQHTGFCAGKDGICYEWKLTSNPSTRLIAYGYEDGVEYSFYKRGLRGSYKHLLRIHPVLKDQAQSNTLFWGYAWDIQDIAIATGTNGQALLATFDHSLIDDGEVYSPTWQKRVPAVLFIGRTTQPGAKVPLLQFKASTPASLRTEAGANNSFKPKPLRGSA